MHQRLPARLPETVKSRADDFQYSFGVFERRDGCDKMAAPRAKVFAIGTVGFALHGHVIESDVRVEGEIAAHNPEQVSQIRERVCGL